MLLKIAKVVVHEFIYCSSKSSLASLTHIQQEPPGPFNSWIGNAFSIFFFFKIHFVMISHSKDLRFSCFSYLYFNIVQWSVKWCSQARSKIQERCNLSCSKTWGNEVNLFLAFSQGGKGLGGDEIDNYLPLEFPRSSSVGTGQYFRYFRIQLTTCLPQ